MKENVVVLEDNDENNSHPASTLGLKKLSISRNKTVYYDLPLVFSRPSLITLIINVSIS